MTLRGPVIAATALDGGGREVLAQAARQAREAGVGLVVAHVVPEIYGIRPLFPHLREADREHAEAVRRDVQSALEAQVAAALGSETPPYTLCIEGGSPHAEVLRLAEERGAGLIVIGEGSHPSGASPGGVAERIIRHAPCPVLVARPGSGEVVIAATDFSDPALPAIEAGMAEARRRGRRFVPLHSVEVKVLPVAGPEGAASPLISHLIDAGRDRARLAMQEIAARFGEGAEPHVEVGPPADVILDAAARLGAELIVVGSHGRSGLRRLTLGSVAETVVRRAACSVLVVRLAS